MIISSNQFSLFFSESNTWEPIDKLNCPDLIKNFEEKIQNQGKNFRPQFWSMDP